MCRIITIIGCLADEFTLKTCFILFTINTLSIQFFHFQYESFAQLYDKKSRINRTMSYYLRSKRSFTPI